MTNLQKAACYCVALGLLVACRAKPLANTEKTETEFIPADTLKVPQQALQKRKYNVFYSFNGECSSCVLPLLDFLKKSRASKGGAADSTAYHFFVMGRDTVLVKYYMNKFKVQLGANQFLISDKDKAIEKLNPGLIIEDATNVILTGSANSVLANGNPFSSQEVMHLYDSIGILHVK